MGGICLDIEKCVGCNACIRNCPVGNANVARTNEEGRLVIHIDEQHCIKCGACISACSHHARTFEDDIEPFMRDLKAGKEIVLFAAPSIKIDFDGNWRHALSWFRHQGVQKIYDVGKIAAISPCIAKSDEFRQTHVIDYNVTMEHIRDYFKEHNIDLSGVKIYSDFKFDDNIGLEGAIYPRPGGLMRNVLMHEPNMHIITSEGTSQLYENLDLYLEQKHSDLPRIFDVLSCKDGCNGGPAAGVDYHCFAMNNIMYSVEQHAKNIRRKQKTKKGHDLEFEMFDKTLQLSDFIREYQPQNVPEKPVSEAEIEKIFHILGKETESEKHFDCHACGFRTCREMAVALARGINEKENCRQYIMHSIRKERQKVENVNRQVLEMNEKLIETFKQLNDSIQNVKEEADVIRESGANTAANMNVLTEHMNVLSNLNESLKASAEHISNNIESYNVMTKNVENIAGKINLLSLNAAIEAARAGEAGRGFAVMASNIRQLSDSSKQSVASAKENDGSIKGSISEITNVIQSFNQTITKFLHSIEGAIADVRQTSENGRTIQESMDIVTKMAGNVQDAIQQTNEILNG